MNWTSFIAVFGVPEFRSIVGGKWWKNFGWLCLICLPAFLAIGLGGGATEYMEKAMVNPFVNFVPVEIPYGYHDTASLGTALRDTSIRNRFHISGIATNGRAYGNFKDAKGQPVSAYIRSVGQSDPFYEYLISTPRIFLSDPTRNNLFGPAPSGNDGWGCFVTEEFLQKLNQESSGDMSPGFLTYQTDNGQEIPIPICGIIPELPNYFDVMVSDIVLQAIKGSCGVNDPFDLALHNSYCRLFLGGNPSSTQLAPFIADGFKTVSTNLTHAPGITLEKLGVVDPALFSKLKKANPTLNLLQIYDFQRIGCSANQVNIEDISIAFTSLDRVPSFQKYIYNDHRLRIDMNIVQARNNFLLFNRLSDGLSIVLISFGILAAFVFILNLISAHLERNKKNIGTLKAFGLTNRTIIIVYSGISATLLTIVLTFCYLICSLTGDWTLELVLKLLGMVNQSSEIGFELHSVPVLLSIFVLLPTVLIVLSLIWRLRKVNPGDLIYERDTSG